MLAMITYFNVKLYGKYHVGNLYKRSLSCVSYLRNYVLKSKNIISQGHEKNSHFKTNLDNKITTIVTKLYNVGVIHFVTNIVVKRVNLLRTKVNRIRYIIL